MLVTIFQKVSPAMRAIHGPAWAMTAVLVAAACHPNPTKIRSEGLERQLNEVTLVQERDSLLTEVTANGKLIGDIQAELEKVLPKPGPGAPENPSLDITKDQRAYTLDRVRDITGRLKAADTQLAASERRVRRLSQKADSLSLQNTEARATITDLSAVVASQRETIATLTTQVEVLTNQTLVLSDSVFHLTDEHNTAYYVVGTRAELLAKGVIVEDGHRAIPLIGKRTVQPARELPLGEFTSIDRTATREIPLPRADRNYRIVSRQDVSHLTPGVSRKGKIQGTIAIAAPDRFWEASSYLIVVEQ